MRAEVKYFDWPDLETGKDPAARVQSTLLVFAAGPLHEPGEETFQLTVCTPEALAELVARDGIVIGRHFLFVETLDPQRVEDFVNDRLRRIDGDTWFDLASKIARIGLWEFEDY